MHSVSKIVGGLALAGASVIFIAGCAGPVAKINSMSFQKGQALSNEEILLKNIIEAAHDRTPTFVAASTINSVAGSNAGVGAVFNIPLLTGQSQTVSPEVSVEQSQSATILDYGATKAARHLYADVPPDLGRHLITRGWGYEVVLTLLLRAVSINSELDDLIAIKANRSVEGNCRGRRDDRGNRRLYVNDARDACAYEKFQSFLKRLRLTGTRADVEDLPVVDGDGREELDAHGRPVFSKKLVERFSDRDVEALFDSLKAKTKAGERPPIVLYLRSPAEIIEFLGRLAALQLYYEPPLIPDVDGVTLFRVVQGAAKPAAVSVRVGGARYSIPAPDPLSSRDMSMNVMSLVIELQNRARQEAPIQGSTIAIVQ